MSARKGRGAKVPRAPPEDRQKASNEMDCPNVSTIDKSSFLEGLQRNNGNPLHSTAIEEDLNLLDDGNMDRGRAGGANSLKAAHKQRGAVVKRKGTEGAEENEEEEEKKKKKRRKRSSGEKVKSKTVKRMTEEERVELDVEKKKKKTVSAPEIKRGLVGRKSEGRPAKNQPLKKDKKTKTGSGSGTQSQEESDPELTKRRRSRVLSSDEEGDEESEWKPSPKKANVGGLGRTGKSSLDKYKKSSSGSTSGEEDKTNKQRKKRQSRKTQTELEVVLDAFLDFCDQYRESVTSEAVKQSIDSFSNNVKDQLSEKISSCEEFRVLRRENVRVGSLIRKKTQRLLNAKHELMRAERQVGLLKKEKTQLELRLADLRRGHAFLQDIGELNRQYLDYRHKHRKEKETYGASSLPALLLEAKYVRVAEEINV